MIQDKGSNYQFYNHTEVEHTKKSVFDLSSLNTLTIPNGGQIIPLAWYETVPTDKFDIDFQAMLRVMPQVLPLYSRQRLFVHAYYSRLSELWNEAETYFTKGYTGKESIKKPVITEDNFDKDLWDSGNGTVKAESLADYLDLPIGIKYSDLSSHNVTCLPFMMYERIYQEYYMNRNFYTENRQWLPNDDGDFRVNTAGNIISVVNNPDEDGNDIKFGKIHVRDWTQDYFTSALPWPQRGNASAITIATQDADANITIHLPTNKEYIDEGKGLQLGYLNWFNVNQPYKDTEIGVGKNFQQVSTSGHSGYMSVTVGPNDKWVTIPVSQNPNGVSSLLASGETRATIKNYNIAGAFSANDIRNLMLNQQELETMARTDGSYAQFGLAFFGEVSKAAKTYKPRYIGGTYQNIEFQEVLQNSQSTEDSPLGSFAGRGGMVTGGNIGTCYCDDYGIIMIVASIVPDTYYNQGLARKWTRSVQEDEYLPDRSKLGMQAILNEELVMTGNVEKDKDVWAWQNRFDELRYMENKIHGKIADRDAESFYPYTQARQFTGETPGYSQEFAKMDDVRKDYLVSETESAYVMQCAIQVRAVRPLPYKAIPASII